jgi:hypothetical protein
VYTIWMVDFVVFTESTTYTMLQEAMLQNPYDKYIDLGMSSGLAEELQHNRIRQIFDCGSWDEKRIITVFYIQHVYNLIIWE